MNKKIRMGAEFAIQMRTRNSTKIVPSKKLFKRKPKHKAIYV